MAKGVFVSLNGFEDLRKRIGEAVDNYVPMLDVEMSEISNQFMNRAAEAAPDSCRRATVEPRPASARASRPWR